MVSWLTCIIGSSGYSRRKRSAISWGDHSFSSLRSLDITNREGEYHDLDPEIEPVAAKSVANSVWYAPGYGPVKITWGGLTLILTGCGLGASPSSKSQLFPSCSRPKAS